MSNKKPAEAGFCYLNIAQEVELFREYQPQAAWERLAEKLGK